MHGDGGAAIAHTAYLNKISCVIIRAISDKADNSASVDYPAFEAAAIRHSVRLIEALVPEIRNNRAKNVKNRPVLQGGIKICRTVTEPFSVVFSYTWDKQKRRRLFLCWKQYGNMGCYFTQSE